MKNNILLFIALFIGSMGTLEAQRSSADARHERYEKVKAAKVGYITEKLKLKESEAQKFWPVYNEYLQNRDQIYHEIRRRIRNGKNEGVTPAEKSRLLDESMALKEKELELQKTFKTKVLDIISVDQYIDLLDAEKEFNKILMERLGKQKRPD